MEVRILSALPMGPQLDLGEQLLRTQKAGSSNLPGSTMGLSSSGPGSLTFNEVDAGSNPAGPTNTCVGPRRRRGLISPEVWDRYPATQSWPVRLGGSGRRPLKPDTPVRIRHGHQPGGSSAARAAV